MSLRSFVVPSVVAAAALVTAALATGHGGSRPTDVSGKAAMTGASSGENAGSMVAVATSPLGRMLVDGSGRTLYLFEADKTDASTCYNACAQAWPPLVSAGPPHAGTGVGAADLGTTTRNEGTLQATYHNHPLYYYAGDTKAGDTTGEGLNQFGGAWYVVAPSGDAIDND